MPQELYHIVTSEYGIRLLCENLFYKDDVTVDGRDLNKVRRL